MLLYTFRRSWQVMWIFTDKQHIHFVFYLNNVIIVSYQRYHHVSKVFLRCTKKEYQSHLKIKHNNIIIFYGIYFKYKKIQIRYQNVQNYLVFASFFVYFNYHDLLIRLSWPFNAISLYGLIFLETMNNTKLQYRILQWHWKLQCLLIL